MGIIGLIQLHRLRHLFLSPDGDAPSAILNSNSDEISHPKEMRKLNLIPGLKKPDEDKFRFISVTHKKSPDLKGRGF